MKGLYRKNAWDKKKNLRKIFRISIDRSEISCYTMHRYNRLHIGSFPLSPIFFDRCANVCISEKSVFRRKKCTIGHRKKRSVRMSSRSMKTGSSSCFI